MKKPFSILCISDLHFDNHDMKPLRQLGVDLLSYTNNDNDVSLKKWIPDYIVVAGDIINQGNKDYSEPQKHIDDLLSEFHLKKNRVIIVPGNHDKTTDGYDLETYKKECDLFNKYQNKESNDVVKEFTDYFVSKFDKYLLFGKNYLSDPADKKCEDYHYKNPNILIPKDADDCKAKLLSGVRPFKDDSVCFVLVNTEWLYVPPKFLMKTKGGYLETVRSSYDEMKPYLSIKENCKLCIPLVNDAFSLIKEQYSKYTIITIMHRSFKDLTWLENNHTDSAQKDPIQQIEAVSDVILTGHDHTVHINPPTYIKNKVQHFQIGSTGRDLTNKEEPIRTACVIRINPASKNIEMLNIKYDGIENCWHFDECNKMFPLRDKYQYYNCKVPLYKECEVVIKAKSTDEDDIKGEIKSYFKIKDDGVLMFCIRGDDNLYNVLENLYKQKTSKVKILFIVVYKIVDRETKNTGACSKIVALFKKNHLADILCNKLILNEISVVVPDLIKF